MSRTFDVYPVNDREVTIRDFLDALQQMFPFDPDALEVYHCGERVSSTEQISMNTGLTCFDIADERIFADRNAGMTEVYWCVESRALEGAGRSFYVAAACTLAVLTNGTLESGDGAWHNDNLYRGEELWQEYLTEEQPYNYHKEPFFSPAFHNTIYISAEKVREAVFRRCTDEAANPPDRLLREICEAAKRHALYFLEKLQQTLGDRFEKEFPPARPVRSITADTPADDLLHYFTVDRIVIEPPAQEGQIEYTLEGYCQWDYTDDGIALTVTDGRLTYFGFKLGFKPTEYESEHYAALNQDREKNFA